MLPAEAPGRYAASMRRYRRLLAYAVAQWPALLLVVALSLALSAVAALQPWPLKVLVDHAVGDVPAPDALRAMLDALAPASPALALVAAAALASFVLFMLGAALDAGLIWLWALAGQRMIYALAADLFAQFQRLSLIYHGRRTVGDALGRLTEDTWSVYAVSDALLVAPARHLLTLAAVGAVAWQLDAQLTLVALLAAPLLAVLALLLGRPLTGRERRERETRSRLMAFVQQTLAATPIVQAFCAEDRNRDRFLDLSERSVAASRGNAIAKRGYMLVNGTAATAGFAVVLYAGGQAVLEGRISLGTLLVFVAYIRSLQNAFLGLLRTYGALKSAGARIERVMEVLEARDRVPESPHARPVPAPGAGGGRHVSLDGVTFGYEPERPVLRDLTLDVRAGETVAIVGATGAGKSTLVSLVPRFFDPWQGRVRIDDVDVRELRLADVRAQVALVLQEPFLLPLSVAENIAYGRPEAGRDEVVAAAVAANAHDFIRALPQGYDTPVGERGVTLSGGERQRLAIARALVKDAPVLILDEPTAALDAGTEAAVVDALHRLMRGRTTIIIAHRLSTVRLADRIAVIEDGRVVEQGPHATLLRAGGRYQRLYALQLAGAPGEEGAA